MNWISVKEELPPEDECVLVYQRHYPYPKIGCYMINPGPKGKCFWAPQENKEAEKLENVTHWISYPPLPEATDEK